MSLEGFSKKGMELGNDPEGIRETKNATDNLHSEYLNSIKRLALTKMKNNFMFEGQLGAVMRRLTSLGFNVTRESILKDIQTEINKQQLDFNLDSLFENRSELDTQLQTPSKVEVTTSPLPKVQAMGTTLETQQQNSYYEQEKYSINTQLQQAQKELAEKLAWAKQQTNEPTYYTPQSNGITEYPSSMYIDDSKIIEYINSKYGNLGKASQILSVSGYPNNLYEVRFEDGNIHQITITKEEQQMIFQQPQQQESKKELQQPNELIQSKKVLAEQILKLMVDAGEFSYIPIEEMSKRLDAIQYARIQLEKKSVEELEIILSTYSNDYEKKQTSGVQR